VVYIPPAPVALRPQYTDYVPDQGVVVSVVVPVHNEQDNVLPLVEEIAQVLPALPAAEVIFVDDGSSDQTLARLQEARQRFLPQLRILQHPNQQGQSTALWHGAVAAVGEWLATLDGDGQNDPKDLLKLVWMALKGGEGGPVGLVIGHRQQRHDSFLRRVSSRIANGFRGWLLKDGVPDTGCGLKVLRRALFLSLPYFDHMHRFLPALVQREGAAVVSVPVGHRPRRAGTAHYGVGNRAWVGLVDTAGVRWLQRRHRRGAVREL